MQEFLHLLSRVLTNVKIMLGRVKVHFLAYYLYKTRNNFFQVKSIVKVIQNVVSSAAGFKSEEDFDYK